jgi:hypothetical protein
MRVNPRNAGASAIFEPLAVTKNTAMKMTAMPKLVQRWLHYDWIEIVRPGSRGRETIIDFASLKAAYGRYRNGEHPPLLPSEARAATLNPRSVAIEKH